MKRTLLVIAALAALSGALGAQELVLTVDQAVEMAVAQNLGLQQTGIALRTKQRAKDTAWNVFLPTMAASVGLSGTNELFTDKNPQLVQSLGDPGAFALTGGLSLSLPLNFAAGSGIRKLVADYEGGLLDYESARKQLERDVRKQFYSLLANQESIALKQQDIALAEKRLTQARNNFANGLSPELEVLSAEVSVESLRPALGGIQAQYDSLMLYFKFLLGVDRNQEIRLDGDLETPLYDLDAEALIDAYLPRRLDIRSLENQIAGMGYAKQTVARNFDTPTLSLGYTYGIRGSNSDFPTDPWKNFSDSSSLSLSLQWKFDGFVPGSSTDVQLKELQDGIDSMILARRQLTESAGMEITNLVNALSTNRRAIEAAVYGAQLAQRNYQLTEEAYRVGTRELLDVESAQQDYQNASQQLVLAKYNYIAALLDLEYALNTPIEEYTALGR